MEAEIRTTLGDVMFSVGEPRRAVASLERAYALRCANLEPDHQDTFDALCRLVDAYRRDGQWDKAVVLFEQILAQRQATHGRSNRQTLGIMQSLAMTYEHLGRLTESLALFEEALKLHRETLGSDNDATGHVLVGYARACQKAGQLDQAEELLREAHERNRREYGLTHPAWAAGTAVDLAWILLPQHRYAEAEAFAREVLPIYEKHSPDDWRRIHAMNLLGGALVGQHRYAEAENLLVAGSEGLELLEPTIYAPQKARLTESLERVARFYEVTHQPEKARAWREKYERAKVNPMR